MVLKNLNFDKTLVIFLGPTAVGKTALSIFIARHFNAEIISADSRQFYKELKIGAAPPDSKELQIVKHHLIGNFSVNDYYNVSLFEQDVLKILERIFKKNNLALMVGGSGLYIDAVCYGIDDLPDSDPVLKMKLKQTFMEDGIQALRFQLKQLDPEYYRVVDLANPKKLIRAIEVCLASGKTYSSLRTNSKQNRNFNIIKIGLNRERKVLYDLINKRVDTMIENGLIDEARNLFPFRKLNALNTVGYKELFDFFENKITLNEAVEKIKTNTRRFAKRQLTWFARDKEIRWMNPDDYEGILKCMEKLLSSKS